MRRRFCFKQLILPSSSHFAFNVFRAQSVKEQKCKKTLWPFHFISLQSPCKELFSSNLNTGSRPTWHMIRYVSMWMFRLRRCESKCFNGNNGTVYFPFFFFRNISTGQYSVQRCALIYVFFRRQEKHPDSNKIHFGRHAKSKSLQRLETKYLLY